MPEISFRDGAAVAGDGVYFVVSRAGARGSYAAAMRHARESSITASVLQDARCLRSRPVKTRVFSSHELIGFAQCTLLQPIK